MFKKYRWNYKTVNANYFCFIFLSGALKLSRRFFCFPSAKNKADNGKEICNIHLFPGNARIARHGGHIVPERPVCSGGDGKARFGILQQGCP